MIKVFCQNKIRVVQADKQLTNHWLAEQLCVTDMTASRWTTNKHQPFVSQMVEFSQLSGAEILDLIEEKN